MARLGYKHLLQMMKAACSAAGMTEDRLPMGKSPEQGLVLSVEEGEGWDSLLVLHMAILVAA